jgi:hypothetical protein
MIEKLLSRLEKVRSSSNNNWTACCPAHNDKNPSLGIAYEDGKILLHCFAQQCSVNDIVEAIGLELQDLFQPKNNEKNNETNKKERQKREYFNPALILRVIDYETTIIHLAATDIINGITWTQTDIDRIELAKERISKALEYTSL